VWRVYKQTNKQGDRTWGRGKKKSHLIVQSGPKIPSGIQCRQVATQNLQWYNLLTHSLDSVGFELKYEF